MRENIQTLHTRLIDVDFSGVLAGEPTMISKQLDEMVSEPLDRATLANLRLNLAAQKRHFQYGLWSAVAILIGYHGVTNALTGPASGLMDLSIAISLLLFAGSLFAWHCFVHAKFSVSVMVDNEEQIFAKNGADLVERPDFSPTSLSAPSAIQFYRAIRCSGRYPTNFEIRMFRVIEEIESVGRRGE